MSRKNRRNRVVWQIRKYCRWCRIYAKRVRMIERETGGCLDAC
ncbi:MAG TPA: hypothetical protein PKL97_07070 [Candidatus Omnitrophota bacterium]|nr:hypothetical protein [Candidatus Omnitrophota bacterium]